MTPAEGTFKMYPKPIAQYTTVIDRDAEFEAVVESLQQQCDRGAIRGWYAAFLWTYAADVNPIWIVGGYTSRARAELDADFQKQSRGDGAIMRVRIIGKQVVGSGRRFEMHGATPVASPDQTVFLHAKQEAVSVLTPLFRLRGEAESSEVTKALYENVLIAGGRDLPHEENADYDSWSAAFGWFQGSLAVGDRLGFTFVADVDGAVPE